LYVHLTDEALPAKTGLVRADQCGPLLVSQLSELLGHDRIVVKPVIDLRGRIAVDAYEIPQRIREHVLLRHTHCIFPWCNRPAGPRTDLDHIVPYDDTGPPGQTATDTVAPECRLHHRIKTFGAWRCRRTPDGAYEWTSPLGRRYRVDHTGTHPLRSSADSTDSTAAIEDIRMKIACAGGCPQA
jgi:hypothetical protein